MKKCVLSAAVLAMLVPAVYAMDGAAEPVVEVEVPAVETQVEVEVTVTAEEAPVEGEVPEVAICELQPAELPEGAVEKGVVDGTVEIAVCFAPDGEIDPNTVDLVEKGEINDEPAHPIMYMFGAPGVAVDDTQPSEGEAVDPNVVDLASQSGIALEARGGEGEIQPNFRNLDNGNGEQIHVMNFAGGALNASLGSDNAANLAAPQLLNDEQRGSLHVVRNDDRVNAEASVNGSVKADSAHHESTHRTSGLGKFMAKFRTPKSEVIQASAATTASVHASAKTDKVLAGKLAEVDRMRDTALRTGDRQALAKADKLEKELRAKATVSSRIKARTK